MSLRKLVDKIAAVDQLPVEIEDVRDELIRLGFQDKIIFSDEDMDPAKLRGILYKFIQRPAVYGDPEMVSMIVYSSRLSIDWQRVVSGKELVHIMDKPSESAKTEEEVQAFLDKLLGPLSTEDFGLADLMAATDKLAVYQCLPLLFPQAARDQAVALFKSGEKTLPQIADWAVLPPNFIELMLGDGWPSLCDLLIDGHEQH